MGIKMKLLEEAAEIETELKRLMDVILKRDEQDDLKDELFIIKQLLKDLAYLTSPHIETKLNSLDEENLEWVKEEVEQVLEDIERAVDYVEEFPEEEPKIFLGFVQDALGSVRDIFGATSIDVPNITNTLDTDDAPTTTIPSAIIPIPAKICTTTPSPTSVNNYNGHKQE